MDTLFLIGRIILAAFFILSGINHLANLKMMSGYARSKGLPAPLAAIGGTGVMLTLGGISILLGLYPVVGIAVLILFLLGASFKIHDFWNAKDDQAKTADKVNFMKNIALIGALLMFLAIPQPWPFSL